MKFFVALSAALLASVHAMPYGGIVNTGASAVSRSDDGHGNYAFGYNEDHATGGTFRKEKGGPGVQVGSYGLRDADGRHRTVNYVADIHGFRASVQTNEPGVDPHQAPAAASVNGAVAAVHAAPAPIMDHGPMMAPAPIMDHGPMMAPAPIMDHGPMMAPAPIMDHAPMMAPAPIIPAAYSVATQHISAAPMIAGPMYGGHGGLAYDGHDGALGFAGKLGHY